MHDKAIYQKELIQCRNCHGHASKIKWVSQSTFKNLLLQHGLQQKSEFYRPVQGMESQGSQHHQNNADEEEDERKKDERSAQ